MKALVIGGAGFIGSHTVDALIERGAEVRVFDSLEKPVHMGGMPPHLNPEAEFILGDVRDGETLAQALKDVEVVFHMAAYQDYLTDFSKFFSVNSVGTALLYETVIKNDLPIKKIVIASSQAVYGEGKYLCDQDGFVHPGIRSLDQLERGDWELSCPACGGYIKPQRTDESLVNPQNQYAMSKYTQELIGINLGRRYEIPHGGHALLHRPGAGAILL